MTKSELIEALARRQTHLAFGDVELAVKNVIEQMSQALATGERIEVRGFRQFLRCITARRVWAAIPKRAMRLPYLANMCRISNLAKSCVNASICILSNSRTANRCLHNPYSDRQAADKSTLPFFFGQ